MLPPVTLLEEEEEDFFRSELLLSFGDSPNENEE
jgi:hypothetical protein